MTTTTVPDNVTMAFRFAQGLWPHDPAAGSEGSLIAWAPSLAGFTVDELYGTLTELAKTSPRMPTLAAWLVALHAGRRGFVEAPRLTAPSRHAITGPDVVYRDKLRKDIRAYCRQPNGAIDALRLAELDAWVDEVGPREQAFLAEHGIAVEVTEPVRKGGGI